MMTKFSNQNALLHLHVQMCRFFLKQVSHETSINLNLNTVQLNTKITTSKMHIRIFNISTAYMPFKFKSLNHTYLKRYFESRYFSTCVQSIIMQFQPYIRICLLTSYFSTMTLLILCVWDCTYNCVKYYKDVENIDMHIHFPNYLA